MTTGLDQIPPVPPCEERGRRGDFVRLVGSVNGIARKGDSVRRLPQSTWFASGLIASVILSLCASAVYPQATVPLRAQVIYAANQPGGVDSRLGTLAGELQKTFRYSMYQLLDSPQGTVPLNQPWRATLPGNRSLEIVPTAIQEGQYSLTVRVLGPTGQSLVNTAVRLRAGATVLVGGPTHEAGVLIIAISAG